LSKETQLREISEQQIYKSLVEQYPEANKFIEDGGAVDRDKSDQGKDINNLKYGRVLDLDRLLPIIFKRASEDLKNASTLLSKANANVEENQNDIDKLKKENNDLKTEIIKLKKEIDDLKMEITKLKKK
jgi:chromosome segregation ATPase